ncbi:death-associated protein kinase related [Scaptodrosophila lebanonensis]|uniref:non-specific serine/threonine protein kinase n=1 Tax=Drosophila lebanonensis TaxID=7225 RepID=A0A6J2U1S6_DROLE|nr:death-associated protein kinase related [Scaptodrosophila lebanonensis]XP_030381428.1 death-associated protein kinase related [Scaptodrosophila lebanonensis]
MFTEEGIFSIGDGLLDVEPERLKGLVVANDINEIYDVEQAPFARGKFAAVRRAIHKNSGLHFAAKFLKRRRRAQSSDKEIKHEIAVLMLCEGEENIVNLNAVHETRSDTALLLELATGGELQTILDNEECLSEAHARICMRQVLKALKFLHERSIAHLDLKPQNILLAGERIEDGLKLCDFGISRVVCEGINVRELAGTPDYVAPEVLQYEPLSLLTDIWSVGVLAYVLLSGFSPFGGDTKQETFLNISQCALTFPDNLFGGVSQAAIDFIRCALRIKPNDRMSAAGCLDHIWLKDECALIRQMYMQTNTDADFVNEPGEDDDGEEDVDEEDVETVESQQSNYSTGSSATAGTQINGNSNCSSSSSDSNSNGSNKTTTHNGRMHSNVSKIPIAASKYNNSNSNGSSSSSSTSNNSNSNNTNSGRSSTKSSPPSETTMAIYTVSGLATTKATTTIATTKSTQIATPTRRASDSDKENTYTATFVKKPAKPNGIGVGIGSTATILIGSSGEAAIVSTATVPNTDNSSNVTTPCLFPDAPTTPKVIRKAPSVETPGTSVKALVKKFQLENGSNSDGETSQHQQQQQQQLQSTTLNSIRKCSMGTVTNMRFICNAASSYENSSYEHSSRHNKSLASSKCNLIFSPILPVRRRASEPLTTGIHRPTQSTNGFICGPLHQSQSQSETQDQNQLPNSGRNVANVGAAPVATSKSSNSNSSSSSSGTTGSSSTNLLLNGRLPFHHHHHMHHHHHVVIATKNAAAAATNNLSLDQGIIC